MNIQQQVCTLAQARLFKQLGILTVSQFYFYTSFTADDAIAHRSVFREIAGDLMVIGFHTQTKTIEIFSAFNVAELGEMLCGSLAETTVWDRDRFSFSLNGDDKSEYFETEAECRAAEVLKLIEVGRLTVDSINELLKSTPVERMGGQ